MKWQYGSMCFICWDTDVLYNNNIAPTLSTYMVMGYSKTPLIKNKITRIDSILQHNSVTGKYSASVTKSVTVF